MVVLKRINAWVSLLLEIAMIAAFAYWGFHATETVWLKWVLGIGAPLAAFIIWGLFLTPRAGQPSNPTMQIIVSLGLLYLAALALYQAGQPSLANIMILVIAVNRTLVALWRQHLTASPIRTAANPTRSARGRAGNSGSAARVKRRDRRAR